MRGGFEESIRWVCRPSPALTKRSSAYKFTGNCYYHWAIGAEEGTQNVLVPAIYWTPIYRKKRKSFTAWEWVVVELYPLFLRILPRKERISSAPSRILLTIEAKGKEQRWSTSVSVAPRLLLTLARQDWYHSPTRKDGRLTWPGPFNRWSIRRPCEGRRLFQLHYPTPEV